MIILDTDCLSLFDREKHIESSKLRLNLDKISSDEIFTTIITFEEQMRGWMAYLSRFKTIDDQLFAYERLNQFLKNYREIQIVGFDKNAAEVYKNLKSNKIRIGTMDLKIASIAISHKAILVSRNLKDFQAVPNLVVNDWTK